MNEKIKAKVLEIDDANIDIMGAGIALTLMLHGENMVGDIPDYDMKDGYRFIAHSILRLSSIVREALDEIEYPTQTGSTEA